ncbi:cytochrome b/b6 domain-containing protein [Dyella sp. C9]|uniref:cytochrome b/b6 domain-containing protein n=1 Tax=Dyella sp. C9 TaxID=2202154 RepID=UPI000DEEEF28|nr:cytochrome b/b6 domain-containing protein [Dyella sp. C9]
MSAQDLDAGVPPAIPEPVAESRRLVYRHPLPIRVMHWINVVALTLMLFSGLQIFNAHPSLYWGNRSDAGTELLTLGARQDATGKLVGITRVGRHEFTTTGVLGVSNGSDGSPQVRGFPSWLTVPGPQWLSMGRRWHFFFAWVFVLNGLCYVGYALATRHLQRDLWPTGSDWRGIGRSIIEHLRFKHPHGDEALRYNILQRLAYLVVIFVFGVGIVLMGLAMSPRMDAVLSPMVEAVGGRQSARTIHFIIAWAFVAFVLIHVFEVLISGVFNQLRGMITGYYAIDAAPAGAPPAEAVSPGPVDPAEPAPPSPDDPVEPAPPEERPHD